MFLTEVKRDFHEFYLRNSNVCTFLLVFILYVTENQEKNENDKFVEFPFKRKLCLRPGMLGAGFEKWWMQNKTNLDG